jgi:hypothetical protein
VDLWFHELAAASLVIIGDEDAFPIQSADKRGILQMAGLPRPGALPELGTAHPRRVSPDGGRDRRRRLPGRRRAIRA